MAAVSETDGSRWTPRILLSLIERFPEGSEFDAEQMGDRQFRDWNLSEYLAAGLINAVQANTIVSGNWKKGHTPEIQPITGPTGPDGKPVKTRAQKAQALNQTIGKDGKPVSKVAQAQARFMAQFGR